MKAVITAIIILLLAAAGLAWLWLSDEAAHSPRPTAVEPAPENAVGESRPIKREQPQPQMAEPVPTPEPPPAPEPIVGPPPQLTDSDMDVRAAATDLAADLSQWLTPEEQVRKWVLLVNNVAAGKVPVKNRPAQFDLAPFQVEGTEDNWEMAAANYRRARPLVDLFVSLDPKLLARYLEAWEPLLSQAHDELGQPTGFDDQLLAAIDRILAVEPLQRQHIELKRPTVYYTYADPELERASELEKLMWRLGPENTVRIQSQLREVRAALVAGGE